MKNPPTLILVRHGDTDLNDPQNERLRGWSNPPLNAKGKADADAVAKQLAGKQITAVFSSDLDRAEETAQKIGAAHGIKPVTDKNLRPWDQGEMTGKSKTEYVPVMMDYIANRPNDKIPGSSESFNTFKARSEKAFDKYAALAKKANGAVVLVSHSRNARMLLSWLQGNLDPILQQDDPVPPGGTVMLVNRGGKWQQAEDVPQEEPTDPIEIGEATLAVVGMTNVLNGNMPRIGVGVQKQILGLGKKIDGLADDFVWDRLPRKIKIPRPFTYRQLLDKFTKPIPMLAVQEIMSKFPSDATDIALSFQSVLTNAFAHLKEIVPVADYDTYLGPKRIQPTSDKTYQFFMEYWLIDDPCFVFQLMQSGALQEEQVTTLKEFFPSLYEYMKAAILNALIARNLKEASFMNLPPRSDRGLAVFKQQRVVPYGVNIHAVPPPKTQSAQPVVPKVNPGLQTSGQKAAGI